MRRALGIAAVWSALAVAGTAAADPPAERGARADEAASTGNDLRARFGIDVADRLMHSADPDERVRGVQRAAQAGTPEALALLVRAAEPNGIARTDARVAIELARALAGSAADPKARAALQSLVTLQSSGGGSRAAGASPGAEVSYAGRLAVARATAAMALASTRDPRIAEWLIGNVRAGGVGQAAAMAALEEYPPTQPNAFNVQNAASPAVLHLVAALGDLRALDLVRAAARSTDPQLRAAALEALGEMGDMRVLPLALAAAKEHDPRVHVAAVEALVALGVPDRLAAVEKLVTDDATTLAGMRLAEHVSSPGIVKALAARALASADPTIRAAAVTALGRSPEPTAVRALLDLARNGALQPEVAPALARSPSADAMAALEQLAGGPPGTKRLALRGYVTRALVRGERSARLDALAAELAGARDAVDRAVGVAAQIALGDRELEPSLRDPDPRVRRAAAVASLARGPDARGRAALLAALAVEKDEPTRSVLAIGLLGGDPDARVSTLALVDRAQSSGPDAPLAAMALARRDDEGSRDKIDALLAAPDPILRAHAARGLGASTAKDAIGRLADAYAYEPDPSVRRAIVLALAAHDGPEADAPQRRITLRLAAALDPEAGIRAAAARAIAGLPAAAAPGPTDVAWLRVTTPDGHPPPPALAGALVRPDGLAVPCVFDDDGVALVPGVPPGDAELVLAPRLPAYEGVGR